MTHAGKKLALEAIGPLDLAITLLQLAIRRGQIARIFLLDRTKAVFDLFPLGDVADDRCDAKSVFGFHWTQADLNGKPRSILPLSFQLKTAAHRARLGMILVTSAVFGVSAAEVLRNQKL